MATACLWGRGWGLGRPSRACDMEDSIYHMPKVLLREYTKIMGTQQLRIIFTNLNAEGQYWLKDSHLTERKQYWLKDSHRIERKQNWLKDSHLIERKQASKWTWKDKFKSNYVSILWGIYRVGTYNQYPSTFQDPNFYCYHNPAQKTSKKEIEIHSLEM